MGQVWSKLKYRVPVTHELQLVAEPVHVAQGFVHVKQLANKYIN